MSARRATAAERFFAEAIDRYGIQEGNRVRIPMRQCELARRHQVAASTVGAYLTAMGSRVVARTPHIVIEPSSSNSDAPEPPSTANSATVLTLLAELVEVQNRLLTALLAAGGSSAERISESVESARSSAESANDPREVLADLPKEGRKVDLQLLPSFLPTERADRALEPRESAQLRVLLQPLHKLCRELHLTPLNNPGPLYEALRPYSDDGIRDAVTQLVREVRYGPARIVSPFGLLTARARNGALLVSESPDQSQTEDAMDSAAVPDDGLLAEVTAYESDEAGRALLDRLDHAIRTENPDLRIGQLPLPMRRALRAEVLRNMTIRRDGGQDDESPESSTHHSGDGDSASRG